MVRGIGAVAVADFERLVFQDVTDCDGDIGDYS